MGTASEASTSLQGVACNMAILAGATGCKRPKSGFWPTRMKLIAPDFSCRAESYAGVEEQEVGRAAAEEGGSGTAAGSSGRL